MRHKLNDAVAVLSHCTRFCIDIETTGVDEFTDKIIGIVVATDEGSWFIRTEGPDSLPLTEVKERLNPFLEDFSKLWINHNIKFDIKFLIRAGFNIPRGRPIHDNMYIAWFINSNWKIGQKELEKSILGVDRPDLMSFAAKKGTKKKLDVSRCFGQEMDDYACDDGKYALQLFDRLSTALKKDKDRWKAYEELYLPLIWEWVDMDLCGARIDRNKLSDLADSIKRDMLEIEKQAHAIAGREFSISSPKQVIQLLFSDLKVPKDGIKKTAGGQLSTGETEMKKIADKHPIVRAILDYRQHSKLHGTYLKSFMEKTEMDGRLHCNWKPTGTKTGRASSERPNLQNIPIRWEKAAPIRNTFIPTDGYKIVAADLSQAELRVMAHISKDPSLTQAYLEGLDVHKLTGDACKCDRPKAKCLAESTLVFTDGGLKTIGSLVPNIAVDVHRPIDTVKIYDGNKYSPSNFGVMRKNADRKVVVTKRGVVVCSDDHRFLLDNGRLVKAKDMKPGDRLPYADLSDIKHVTFSSNCKKTVRCNPFTKEMNFGPSELVLDEKWAYLLGVFAGDGTNLSGDKRVSIAHGSGPEYREWRDTVGKAISDCGLVPSMGKDMRYTRIGSRVAGRLLHDIGFIGKYHSSCIRIPDWVLTGGEAIAWEYLAGLFDTDGTVGHGAVRLVQKDPEFLGQVIVLMRSLGIEVTVAASFNKTYKRYYYQVNILPVSRRLFFENCRLRSHKKQRLSELLSRGQSGRHVTDDWVLLVEDYPPGDVFDIQIDNEDHIYIQGGIAGHNSVNFGVIYLMGPHKLCEQLNWEITADEARKWIRRFFLKYPGVKVYHATVLKQMLGVGYVRTIIGRRIYRPDNSCETDKHHDQRTLVNATIQGSVADAINIAMRNIRRRLDEERELGNKELGEKSRFLLQIHDEIVMECPNSQAELLKEIMVKEMENAIKISVPMVAEAKIGDSWGECK